MRKKVLLIAIIMYNIIKNAIFSNNKVFIYMLGYKNNLKKGNIELLERTELILHKGVISKTSPFLGKKNICQYFEDLIEDIISEYEKHSFKFCCPCCCIFM